MKSLKFNIPEIGLVGFDNIEWTKFSSPTLTTIIQPAYEEGEQATKILIDDIEGHSQEAKQQILTVKSIGKNQLLMSGIPIVLIVVTIIKRFETMVSNLLASIKLLFHLDQVIVEQLSPIQQEQPSRDFR